MKSVARVAALCLVVAIGLLASSVYAQSVWHDPWLNWDFQNRTPSNAYDFDVIVESGDFSAAQWWSDLFDQVGVTHADYDGDGDMDTKISFSSSTGGKVASGQTLHTGMYMLGSSTVQDAYWTDQNGQKLGYSIAISYEKTEIRQANSKEVHMHLQIAPGFYDDPLNPEYPYAEAGWTEIRTFVNIPAYVLDLPDLNRELDLSSLAMYEVQPKNGLTGEPILLSDTVWDVPDSFFDVYLATIPDEYASPAYESLLHAVVLNQGQVVGEFWNLNPQCPEPGTLLLLGAGIATLGGLAYRSRNKRS